MTALTYQPENKSVFIRPDIKLKRTAPMSDAERIMQAKILTGRPFSADDIHEMVPGALRNEIGTMFRRESIAGKIIRIGDFRSASPSRRGGRNGIWIDSNAVSV